LIQAAGNKMIWTFRIKLMGCEDEWSVHIEIDSSSTLEQLHHAIQKAVNFDNDHLYAFYIAKTDRGGRRQFFDDDNGQVFSMTLADVFPLEPRKSFFYLFDFGDEWVFRVTKTQKRPHDPLEGVDYPRAIREVGTKPVQYPGYY